MFKDQYHRVQRRLALWKSQQQIVRLAHQVAAHAPESGPSQAPVVIFAATTRLGGFTLNAAFALLTGWSLRLAGVPVVNFVCQAGMTHCVLGTNSADLRQPPPCLTCIDQSIRLNTSAKAAWFIYEEDPILAEVLNGLSVDELSKFEFTYSPLRSSDTASVESGVANGAKIPLGRLVLSSVRWALRRHHLQDDSPTRNLMREYILSSYSLARQFDQLLGELKPAAVVCFNGILYPEATARWVARQRNVRSVAFEVGFQPFSVFFSAGEPTAYPIHIPTEFELDDAQNAKLDALLEKRFQGKFTMAGIRFWPEMRGLDEKFLEKIARFRQVVPVFTNVVYDSSQVHANTLFSNMFDWLDLLLEIMRAHPETLFVIRAHPDEKRPVSNKMSNESVHDWIYRNQVDQLANVVFIEPDEFISSYELIQQAKFVLVYNSSIGLEATLLGAPVVCGGKARYTQVPTVFLPETPEALGELCEEFLKAEDIEVPPEFMRNARRFLYYQFFRISLPMNAFLHEGEKQGSVFLSDFDLQTLRVENSPTMKILYDGILHNQPFEIQEA